MTSIETSLEQIRRLNERHRQQIDALTRPAKEMSRLAESLRMPVVNPSPDITASIKATRAVMDRFADIKIPAVKLSTEFTTSMKATQAIMDRFADIKNPAVKLSTEFTASMKATQAIMDRFADIKNPAVKLSAEFTASMKATQAIMDRFADIRVPALKQYDKISTILTRTHEHLAPITMFNSRPALLHHRGLDFMLTIPVGPPVVSQVSPAEDVLRRVSEQYQRQKKREEDHRHIVVIAVTLLTGKRLCDPSMSTHGDHLIRILGEDSSKQRHDVVVGYASFQYEILTIEIPPQSPTLRIV